MPFTIDFPQRDKRDNRRSHEEISHGQVYYQIIAYLNEKQLFRRQTLFASIHTLFNRGSTQIAMTMITLPRTVTIVNAAKPIRRAIMFALVFHVENASLEILELISLSLSRYD